MAKKAGKKTEQQNAEEESKWGLPRSYKAVRLPGVKVVSTEEPFPKMLTPEERAAVQKEAQKQAQSRRRQGLGVTARSPRMYAKAVALELHEVAQKLRRLAAATLEGDTQPIRQRYQLEVEQFDGDLDGISDCLEGLRDLINAQDDDSRR